MNNDLTFIREICKALEAEEDKYLDYSDPYILEKLLKIDAVRYILRKEKKSKVDDPQLQEIYENIDKDEREEIRKNILKNIKIKNRTKAKIEREKKQKEYFKQQEKISEERKSRDITKKIKVLLTEGLLENNENEFRFNTLNVNTIISQSEGNTTLNNNITALSYIRKNNFFKFNIGETFKCQIVEGNNAWISKDEDEHVRYFSKNQVTGEFFYLDIIDLVEIYYECGFVYAFIKTMEILGIKSQEEQWRKMENEKYRNNIKIVQFAHKQMEMEYPILYSFLKDQLITLQQLNELGKLNIKTTSEDVEGDAIFFGSYSYLAKHLGLSKSYVGKSINIFALLELVVIVPEPKIPYNMLERAKKEAKGRKNKITFYTIPFWDNTILRNAENMARKLRFHKISTDSISSEKVEKAFGEGVANKIYGNTKENIEKIAEVRDIKKQCMKQIIENIEEDIRDEAIPF